MRDCRALRLRGYTVLEADSAEAALKTLEDESLNVDVFVTDVVMPDEICDKDFFSVSADCNEEWGFTCDCCTCCVAPCPVANLPMYSKDPTRFLFALD